MSYTTGRFVQQARQVLVDDTAGTPENTLRAYDNKTKEYLEFCRHAYGNNTDVLAGLSPYTITEEKFFGFMYYQSRRAKKSGGCRKIVKFNTADYDHYMTNTGAISQTPCGYSVLNQYRSSLLKLYQTQIDNGANNATKTMLMSDRIKTLLDNVKKRKITIAKENFEEKITHEFAPYATIAELPRLEEHLFNRHSLSVTFMFSSLRDRFCLLMTTNAILRGESLFKCDLSDLCDLQFTPNDSDRPVLVHVMRVSTGKTNCLKVLYGRCV